MPTSGDGAGERRKQEEARTQTGRPPLLPEARGSPPRSSGSTPASSDHPRSRSNLRHRHPRSCQHSPSHPPGRSRPKDAGSRCRRQQQHPQGSWTTRSRTMTCMDLHPLPSMAVAVAPRRERATATGGVGLQRHTNRSDRPPLTCFHRPRYGPVNPPFSGLTSTSPDQLDRWSSTSCSVPAPRLPTSAERSSRKPPPVRPGTCIASRTGEGRPC